MVRRTLTVLLVAGSIGGLAAGCGSSSTPNSSPGSTSAGTTAGTGTSAAGSGGGASSNPAVQAAVAACKNKINSSSQVPASLKSKLTKLCDQAANGNLGSAKKVAQQVCDEVVKAELPSSTPTSIRNQALAACKKAG
jgi:hypothetical protein